MKTAGIFADVFIRRTTGRRATFTVVNLTLDAVKIVLRGEKLKLNVEGALEDVQAGYLRRANGSGYYGGADGYLPTAKGYRKIHEQLNR